MITEEIIEGEAIEPTVEIENAAVSEPTEVTEEPSTERENAPEVTSEAEVDYAELMENDIRELKRQFPELLGMIDLTELDNPLRYAALRDLGLSPREAYLATSERSRRADNRSHLSTAVPRGAGAPRGGMSREELYHARELFGDLSDAELQSLYRKVNA